MAFFVQFSLAVLRKASVIVAQLSCEEGWLVEACASADFDGLLIADPSTASEPLALRSDATPAITCDC